MVLPTCCLVAATKMGRGRLFVENSRDNDGGALLLIEMMEPLTIMLWTGPNCQDALFLCVGLGRVGVGDGSKIK